MAPREIGLHALFYTLAPYPTVKQFQICAPVACMSVCVVSVATLIPVVLPPKVVVTEKYAMHFTFNQTEKICKMLCRNIRNTK